MVDVLLGLQWGDEGKGKIVDFFAKDYQLVARFQGGPNAGHTLYVNDQKIVLHQIPSGIFHAGIQNLIGNGVVLDPVTLRKECAAVAAFGVDVKKNLFISERAHLILPTHRALDKAAELSKGEQKIGSTLKGIGPTYMDKTGRNGLRVGDLLNKDFKTSYIKLRLKHQQLLDNHNFQEDISAWETEFFEAIEFLRGLNIVNGEYFINEALSAGKRVLAEGAQGSMLDIDFGTFPFVTSSNTISAGVCNGLGIAPQRIREVFGVTKAYCTRVGGGPFPTELEWEKEGTPGWHMSTVGAEKGVTTGRSRRCGWFDAALLKRSAQVNGLSGMCITKLDVLDGLKELKLCTGYELDGEVVDILPMGADDIADCEPVYETMPGWTDSTVGITDRARLPVQAQAYLKRIEEVTGVPIHMISCYLLMC